MKEWKRKVGLLLLANVNTATTKEQILPPLFLDIKNTHFVDPTLVVGIIAHVTLVFETYQRISL